MKYAFYSLAALASFSAFAEEEVKPFTLNGEFGMILTTGNTETTSINAKLSAHHETDSWSNDYIIEGLYNQDEVENDLGEEVTETTAQRFFVSGQGNYKLENEAHRLFIFGSYEDNRFSNFSYQSTVAAGWSQKVWDNDKSSFGYSVGPGYTYNETLEGETVSGLIVRGALDYQWNVSDTAVFRQLLSTEVGSDNTKSRSETSLSAQINGSLSMKLSLTMDHNSDVNPGVKKLDTQTAVTLVYTFF